MSIVLSVPDLVAIVIATAVIVYLVAIVIATTVIVWLCLAAESRRRDRP